MNYAAINTDLLTLGLALALLVAGLIIPRRYNAAAGYIAIPALAAILVSSLLRPVTGHISFFGGLYEADALTVFFKQVFLMAAILVAAMSLDSAGKLEENGNEYFALLVFALVGMMALVSASDLITLYIGLELMSITFIILTALETGSIRSSEAGAKYILLSAMSSCVLLFGASILYGLSGSLVFSDIAGFVKTYDATPIMAIAIVMVLAGFAFKISAVPFHMWSPDVYEGAPTPVTAFLAIGSKAAAFGALIRVLFVLLKDAHDMVYILIITLVILTVVAGNLTAIPQKNIKRLLAYSSIAHAGYILVGAVAFNEAGIGSMLFYILQYVFANAGAFAAVTAFSNQTGSTEINDFSGMWKRSPLLAAALSISLLSLAGIPPAAGFTGKFLLFAAVIRQGYLWLAFIAMGMSVVSVYYYILVMRTMLMNDPIEPTPVKTAFSLKAVMVVSAAVTVAIGIYPGPVIEWTGQAAALFLK